MNIPLENLEKISEIITILKNLEQKIMSEKRWLNIEETAHYLGYSKAHIHKLKDTHFIETKHYYKKTGRLLFDKQELDNWVMSSTENINPQEIADSILDGLI